MTDSMLQQLIVIAIVLAAAGFVALKAVRAVRAARGKRDAACASGCGCGPAAAKSGVHEKRTTPS